MGFPCRDIAFYAATVGHFVTSEQGRACSQHRRSIVHDRPWAHAIVWRHVTSRQIRLGAHGKPGHAHDKGLLAR